MNKYAPEIASLRLDIEQSVKRKIRTPYDFEFLSGVIWERLHENISPTTLKRLWGYIEGADTTRRTTYHPSSAYHPLRTSLGSRHCAFLHLMARTPHRAATL